MGTSSLQPSPFSGLSTKQTLTRLEGPLEAVRGLPNEAFTSQSFYELERETVFSRGWTFAGRASTVPGVGDIEPIWVAGQPLLMVRDSAGEVRLFHNVCPHRGARIAPQPAKGKRVIVCPYHAWTFALDGVLRSRPHYHGPGETDYPKATDVDQPCLHEVRSARWSDLVLANLDGNAPPFETYIADIRLRWSGFDIDDIECTHYFYLDLECNWKLAVENYCDFYHVFRVHPSLDRALADNRRTGMVCDGAVLHNENWADESRATVTVVENAPSLPALGGAVEEGRRKTVFGIVFPNTAINIHRSEVQFTHFEPLAPGRTRQHRWIYFPAAVARDGRYREVRDRVSEDWRTVLKEDEQICESVQLGRQSKAYDGGRLAPEWDAGTRHFHRLVMQAVSRTEIFAGSGAGSSPASSPR